MTAPASTVRRRRSSAATVPPAVADWFAGQPVVRRPLLFARPHYWQVSELWRAWVADHRGATPPDGWAWLADPRDQRHRRPAFVTAAATTPPPRA